jgi:hypothetical protein
MRHLEDSPRITQPYEVPEFGEEDRRLKMEVAVREWDAELRKYDPDVAQKLRFALACGDIGPELLRQSLTLEEAMVGLSALLTAIARTWGAPGVPA